MTELARLHDKNVVTELHRLSKSDDEYWAFRGRSTRHRMQGLTQYPAMMVPAMQAELMRTVTGAGQGMKRVFDPFAGSGTTLVESMRLGLDYTGYDINPLAVLFCKTKAGPFHTWRLQKAVRAVLKKAKADRSRKVEVDFPGLRKWFSPVAITELSKIRRAIRDVDHIWCRRVLWTGLAETVRLTSNSRTSTFKLHIRSKEDLESRVVSPLETFHTVMHEISDRLEEEAEKFKAMGHISKNGHYRGNVNIRLRNSTEPDPKGDEHDLLVTSPPYGDNTTTVPYGQYSFLPLQWIDLKDIDEQAGEEFTQSAYYIDGQSLGGYRNNPKRRMDDMLEISPSLKKTLHKLEKLPSDRKNRVAAFVHDLNVSLGAVVPALRQHGYMIWTIGNRRVGGKQVPTDKILRELLEAKGIRWVTRLDRKIPSKRMATRNSIASTMRREAILVFRKA